MDLYSRGIALPEGTQPKVGPHGITGGEISVMKKEHKVFAFPESEDVESVGMVLKIKV